MRLRPWRFDRASRHGRLEALGVHGVQPVAQPINICLHARPVGGELTRTKEAAEVAWVATADLEDYDIHPAIRLRITHGLSSTEPHVG